MIVYQAHFESSLVLVEISFVSSFALLETALAWPSQIVIFRTLLKTSFIFFREQLLFFFLMIAYQVLLESSLVLEIFSRIFFACCVCFKLFSKFSKFISSSKSFFYFFVTLLLLFLFQWPFFQALLQLSLVLLEFFFARRF